jgi:hypothetical protein
MSDPAPAESLAAGRRAAAPGQPVAVAGVS